MGSFRLGLVAALAASLLMTGAATLAPASYAATGASISGTVTNGGTPIGDIFVYAYGPDGDPTIGDIADTDSLGRYTLTGLAEGSWILRFVDRFDTFDTEYYEDAAERADADAVTVGAAEQRTGIDAVLAERSFPPPGTDISGTVLDPAGQPIVETEVAAYRNEYDPEEFEIGAVEYAETDRYGRYSFTSLSSAAAYRIEAEPLPDVGDPYPFGLGSMPTWFGQATRFRRATPVTVEGSNVDITLRRYAGISGRISEASGPLTAPAGVLAFNSSQRESGFGTVDDDGSYELLFLDPDEDHRVEFIGGWDKGPTRYVPSWFANAPGFASATPVPVTSGQVTSGVNGTLGRELVNTVPPTFSGQAQPGSTLTASPGRWNSEEDTTFEYSWDVDGRVAGTGASFVPLPRHAGLSLRLRVTARYEGVVGNATSAPVTVARGAAKMNVHARYRKAEDSITIMVRVFAGHGSVEGGSVTFRDSRGGKKVTQVVRANIVRFQVSDPKAGKHRLVFRFSGTLAALPATQVKVVRVP